MYRSITGDQIDPGSRIAGSGLFGGPIGTVVALANVTIEQKTGQDIGSHMMALFTKQDDNLKTQISDDFANTSESAGITSDASPITTHAEVLEWAQREIAHSAETAREAQSKNIIKLAKNVGANQIVCVVAKNSRNIKNKIKSFSDNTQIVEQPRQLGTGHAVLCAEEIFSESNETILILYGDCPLISEKSIKKLLYLIMNMKILNLYNINLIPSLAHQLQSDGNHIDSCR